eukprot:367861-Rhodomonas_salina.3
MYVSTKQARHSCRSWENVPEAVPAVVLMSRYPVGQSSRKYSPVSRRFHVPVIAPEVGQMRFKSADSAQEPSSHCAPTGHRKHAISPSSSTM